MKKLLRYLNPLNWFRKSDGEIVAEISRRAMLDGSTLISEDECGAVERWCRDYEKKAKEKE